MSAVNLDFNYTGTTPSIPGVTGVWRSYESTGNNTIDILKPPSPPAPLMDSYDEVVFVFKNPVLNRTVVVVKSTNDSRVQVPVEELGGSPIQYNLT